MFSFPRPFQQSLACFRVARSPSNSWASCFDTIPECDTSADDLSSDYTSACIVWSTALVITICDVGIPFVVFQTRADERIQSFGCPPGHVIKIHSAKVGIIPKTYTWNLDDSIICSWPVDQKLWMCDELPLCHLPDYDVYNKLSTDYCRPPPQPSLPADLQMGDVINVTYKCIVKQGMCIFVKNILLFHWQNAIM